MAKKNETTIEKVLAEGGIRTSAKIKKAAISKNGVDLAITGIQLTGPEYKEITNMVKDEESVVLILVPSQMQLFNGRGR